MTVGLLLTTFLGYFGAISLETLERRMALSDKDQQESCAVAGKPHDAVKFDTY